jgi:ATP-dependent Clp protease protease subunit
MKTKGTLNKIVAGHTGQPLDRVNEDTDRDFFMTGDEAKEYGVVDEVIYTIKEKK